MNHFQDALPSNHQVDCSVCQRFTKLVHLRHVKERRILKQRRGGRGRRRKRRRRRRRRRRAGFATWVCCAAYNPSQHVCEHVRGIPMHSAQAPEETTMVAHDFAIDISALLAARASAIVHNDFMLPGPFCRNVCALPLEERAV